MTDDLQSKLQAAYMNLYAAAKEFNEAKRRIFEAEVKVNNTAHAIERLEVQIRG